MIFKFLAFAAVLFLIYILLFKKNRVQNNTTTCKKKRNDDKSIEELVECPKCGTFVSKNEAILSNGKYYCSKECLQS